MVRRPVRRSPATPVYRNRQSGRHSWIWSSRAWCVRSAGVLLVPAGRRSSIGRLRTRVTSVVSTSAGAEFRSGAMLLRTTRESIERAIAEAGLAPRDIVVTVLGTPGIPDVASGTVHRAPNLPGWERRGLLHELVSTLGADGSEVIVENDANLCAVGEHALGAARGVDVIACLTVGTGIGMGILVNGKLFRGAHGAAGEIADLPYDRVPAGVTAHRPGPVEIVAAAQAVVSAV